MWLYDLLALFRNVRRHRMLGKRALLEREPCSATAGLRGRRPLLRRPVRRRPPRGGHRALGARARRRPSLTYTAVTGSSSDRRPGRGRRGCDDVRTGARSHRARVVVVNATGPWADQLRRLEDPRASRLLRPTKGAHVVVPRERLGNHEAITFTSPIDGRVMFVLPWGAWSYIGTTDTDTAESPDEVRASSERRTIPAALGQRRFPNAHLGEEDVSPPGPACARSRRMAPSAPRPCPASTSSPTGPAAWSPSPAAS